MNLLLELKERKEAKAKIEGSPRIDKTSVIIIANQRIENLIAQGLKKIKMLVKSPLL